MKTFAIPLGTRDLSPELIHNGSPIVAPAGYYACTSPEERAMFGHKNACYGFVTLELIQWLQKRIGTRTAIEIGAGNGVLAAALGIPATDSKMQTDPQVAAAYAGMGQPTIEYGRNVRRLNAKEAVKEFKPQVVIANWVTHLYRPIRHEAGGNMYGVNEEQIISKCEEYIFIGNEEVHAGKSIWDKPHEIIYPDWLYSRSVNGSRNFIAIWS